MNEVMTMTEIEKQFDKEWILLEDPVINERKQIAGGKLLFHSKNRDEVYQAAIRIRPKHAAFLYTGPIQEEQNLLRSSLKTSVNHY